MNSYNPLAAMIWKESRENLKWATLGFVATGGALMWALWYHAGHQANFNEYYRRSGSPLITDEFQAVTTICTSVVGLLLGLAQTLPEKRPDQWAFLTHRPVSRSRLFIHKSLAGILLYFLAVGVPYACTVAWVATPGHVPAPFMSGLMLPGLTDVLAGLMYYFAAMAVGLREARWYGSRIMAAGIAVAGSFAAVLCPEFGWSVFAIAVGVGILATAAWGCFITGGRYASQPLPAKATLGVAVFTGIVMLGSVCVALVASVLVQSNYGGGESRHSYYQLDDNGQAVCLTYDGQRLISVTDLAGQPIPKYASAIDAESFAKIAGALSSTSISLDPRSMRNPFLNSYRRPSRYYVDMTGATDDKWYYLPSEKYLVGYESRHRRLITYTGPAGFSAAEKGPPKERFQGTILPDQSSQTTLATTHAVYNVDFQRPCVTKMFTVPPGEELLIYASMQRISTDIRVAAELLLYAFVTNKSLYAQSVDGKLLMKTLLEQSPATGYDEVEFYRGGSPERSFLWYKRRFRDIKSLQQDQLLTEVSAAGEVISRQAVPSPWRSFRPPAMSAESSLMGALMPPIGFATILAIQCRVESHTLAEQLSDPALRVILFATLISGVICAAFTVALTQHYSFSRRRTIGWAAAMLFLGPAGVLTLLSLNSWRPREKCPSCGRKRVIDRESCPRCGAEFSFPPLDGTEIFST